MAGVYKTTKKGVKMKLLKKILSAGSASLAIVLFTVACQNSNPSSGNSGAVTTPTTYSVPNDAPTCVQGRSFHDHDELCEKIRDDRAECRQERYDYFNRACHGHRWQDRH